MVSADASDFLGACLITEVSQKGGTVVSKFKLAVTDVADHAVRTAISSGLAKHNRAFADEPNLRPLIVVLRGTNGGILGGLWGKTAWGWLNVELLYVSEQVRGLGLGTELIMTAEAEALMRNCWSAWVDTYSFQARNFYERRGYSVFGALNNYPMGHCRFFLQKLLDKQRLTTEGQVKL